MSILEQLSLITLKKVTRTLEKKLPEEFKPPKLQNLNYLFNVDTNLVELYPETDIWSSLSVLQSATLILIDFFCL